MQVFIRFEEVEKHFAIDVNNKVASILLTDAKNGEQPSKDVIFDYLGNTNWKDRLSVIVGLSGGSIERLQRICDVILPRGKKYSDMAKDRQVREKIADFLSDPVKLQEYNSSFYM